jgi:hypothetical protein
MDLGGWLRSLGLEQYEVAFRENAIDDTVLPSLTAEDVKDLGVVIVGHRRKLLDAIAALRADAQAKAPPFDALPTIDRSAKDTAERRQVTVMFSDLVGSTALSARMDPEDLREVISAYQKCVAETVRRFGGFVAKYMGDGVLVYFGYPQAHEDDAERTVRAGLELTAAVTGLKTRAPLQTRVGIATGLVVVGDLIGSAEAQDGTPAPGAMLKNLKGIGPEFAGVLWSEGLFRSFSNRRQVAAYAGLAPTPWRSGSVAHEQGVSKAGNPRLRTTMIQLAWLWVRHQPRSILTLWFHQRTQLNGGRVRKVLIVALARKLLIAFWKYVTAGVVLEGADTTAA